MSRLIDADEFKKQLDSAYEYTELSEIIKMLDNAPTVLHDNYSEGYQDGVRKVLSERPQGEWIYHKGFSESRECSVCGVWIDWSLVRNSFCPNCGADMRGGKEE